MSAERPETFGALLRRYRLHAGLTQEALAERAGLSPNAISALERGERRSPYPHTIQALANALKLDPEKVEHLVQLREQGRTPSAARGDASSETPRRSSFQPEPRRQGAAPLIHSSLIGREAEYEAIAGSLTNPQCRLLTLSGPGGVGKTRLAIQIATDLAARYADGVIWVSLAPVTDADQVPLSVAESLHLQLCATEPVVDQILGALHHRQCLFVLDNMEHVLEAVDLVETLLASAPALTCLVTSRERLGSKSEWLFDLQGLALPEGAPDEEVPGSAAVQLFQARAQQAVHDFVVNAANQTAVIRICQLVDGLPLGIELAAAWVRTLSPEEIAEEISNNFEFLRSKDRGGPARHSSLQAVFEHSWNLLGEEERQVFARLAVFRGGCDRSAAEAVGGAQLPLLAMLVDKSLLRSTPDAGGPTRFDLHQLLQQFTLAKLQTNPDEERLTRDRHCAYFARVLGERTQLFLSGDAHAAWSEVAVELDNIRAAWAWAVQRRDHKELARMGPGLYLICEFHGYVEEGLSWFRAAAHALRTVAGETRNNPEVTWTLGQILSLYGKAAAQGGHYRQGRDQLLQGYELLRQRGDILVATGTLVGLGYTDFVLGSYDKARTWFTESIGLARAHGATYSLALSESMLALAAQAEGAEDALAFARAGLEDCRVLGQPHGLTTGLWALSCVLQAQGALAEAQEAAQEALQLSVELQHRWGMGSAMLQLGAIALAQGNVVDAHAFVQESVDIFSRLGEPWSLGRALVVRGWVAEGQRQHHEARRWFEQALKKARAAQLDPIACSAQYGLAFLIQEEAPAAALAFLDQVVNHRATESTIRERANVLRQSLAAAT